MIRFRRLTPAVVREDHAALMRDIPLLRAWSGQDWPTPDFSVEENLVDLERHDREHEEGIAFTYSVLLDDVVVGCIYVRPFADALTTRATEPPDDPQLLTGTAVRGWSHDVTADELIAASLAQHGADFGPTVRRWWQTNTDCPEQLAACDRLGLTDERSYTGPTTTWVLRAVPE
ncbi:MAG: hypothetical protein ACOYMR_06685 [Ilumatobacteraceae bacterium]